MTLIDGKAVSEQVKQEIAAEVAEIVARGGKRPHLAAILVGHDGGSETYVAAKVKACEVCGFKSTLIRYESDVTEEELLAKVQELNADPDVDGFIVQLPLPAHISEQKVIETIDYRKDVDGFHPINVGRLSIGLPCYISATPNGIMELLRRYQIDTKGKKMTLCELYAKKTAQRINVKKNTLAGRKYLMDALKQDKLGSRSIDSIKPSDAKE
jgi:methylenetetrahydrofolate dehydrogenase (NADP+)/methenyltetrahydrofolate cyclohydrolase